MQSAHGGGTRSGPAGSAAAGAVWSRPAAAGSACSGHWSGVHRPVAAGTARTVRGPLEILSQVEYIKVYTCQFNGNICLYIHLESLHF